MKEPLSLRVSDADDPRRGKKFGEVLSRKKANASDVIRGLIDAYIESDGLVDFPVRLEPKPCTDGHNCPPLKNGYDGDGARRRTGKTRR